MPLFFLVFLSLLSLITCQPPPQLQPLPLSQSPSYYGEFNGAHFGYPPIPNLLPQFQAMNLVGATSEPRRSNIPKQADGTDCPMPPECGCLCGRSGKRKKREVEWWKEEETEIRCTSSRLRRAVEKALSSAFPDKIHFDLGINSLEKYVLFCQPEKFSQLQFSTDSSSYCHVSRGPVNCLIIQHD